MHILIIGGGPAAVEAALSAREQNKQADITIVSNENIEGRFYCGCSAKTSHRSVFLCMTWSFINKNASM